MMKTIFVGLDAHSYSIHIGNGLLSNRELLSNNIRSKQVMVVTNTVVAPLYLQKVLSLLSGYDVDSVILSDGEQYKTYDSINNIISSLLSKQFSRNSCLVALGGGVIGDITGFAAACYQRGIDFAQIPTTLLAQVDSSVGGKTGINHPAGKNMIGAFHQPITVIVDTSVLETLHEKELRAGLAEVIKYGLIRDAEFFAWMEDNIDNLLARDLPALTYVIERSCRNKVEVVVIDEHESGIRAILNFGHTFAHAIETGLGYGVWLHGEAVALGMLIAAELSYRMGWISQQLVARIRTMLEALNLPVMLPLDLQPLRIRELMSVDKKVKDKVLSLVLLQGIGNAIVTNQFDESLLMETLNHFVAE